MKKTRKQMQGSKEVPATRGNIRAGIALMVLMTMIIGILLVL